MTTTPAELAAWGLVDVIPVSDREARLSALLVAGCDVAGVGLDDPEAVLAAGLCRSLGPVGWAELRCLLALKILHLDFAAFETEGMA